MFIASFYVFSFLFFGSLSMFILGLYFDGIDNVGDIDAFSLKHA